jgi:predicted AlkP superfamily pyrophosphatase or phosphodiesterase
MATGLYPNNHGIVQNRFYAADVGKEFAVGSAEAIATEAFWGGEPVWVTAKKQGVKTAAFYWVGSETPVQGMQPDIWKPYDHLFPFAQRVDTVVQWLELSQPVRPHLIMWYFHEPDEAGHHYGPESPQTAAQVYLLDSLMGVFMDRLSRLPIADSVNVIVTSDHGMTALSPERTVCIDDYVSSNMVERVYAGASTLVYTKPKYREQVYADLQKMPHVKVYRREEMPERYHYGSNPRIGDLVVVADCGWTISRKGSRSKLLGAHGYDNACKDMDMIFFAYGPAFRQGYVQPPMANVDLYPLITRILGIEPAANDGDMERVEGMLK